MKEKKNVFIFFTGDGLRYLYNNDELIKTSFESLERKFDLRFNPLSKRFGFKNIYLDE